VQCDGDAQRHRPILTTKKKSQRPTASTLLNGEEEGAMSYRQLTLDERYHIEVYLNEQLSQAEIARRLNRHPATISREIRRNSDRWCVRPYRAKRAAWFTGQRRIDKGERSRKIRGALQRLVEERLRWSWSPEQICGRLRLELGISVSHETIYQHVLRDARRRGYLRYCLRFGGYKHFRFKKSHMAERTRARKRWVDQRPAAANERTEIGHWERDCIVGRRGGKVLLTMVDRRSRYTRMALVRRPTADLVAAATCALLAPHRQVTKTLTNDNGKEFGQDETLERRLGVPIYFTEPSAPWQRGSIENLNGLVRQYIPKGTQLEKVPNAAVSALEETLNHRPRKNLGFKTPYELFFDEKRTLMNQKTMHFGMKFNSPC
jgi:IS30 family transposase